ncbi:hypothetical protein [Ruminococcus sp.]|uniref:hypothetical protein n=1 Tax=Ruminococcus sp. TaxID=41978 RepID=UPI002629C3BF|nr:hypothetical protein [Ruminococcus sp.]MDD6989751.1 hypothetical protein [Ruminococcus sp.]MDY6201821.1 hypothetical protein [Ruminococcus sp.]
MCINKKLFIKAQLVISTGTTQKRLPVLHISGNSIAGTTVHFRNQVVFSCHWLRTSYRS